MRPKTEYSRLGGAALAAAGREAEPDGSAQAGACACQTPPP